MDASPSGYIPRDYASFPPGYLACAPVAAPDWLIPENEQEERLREQKAKRTNLLELRNAHYAILKSLNQTTHPLCWGFSTTKSAMYALASSGELCILSPWWTAGVSNGWKNQGGWCSLSLQGLAETGGVPMIDCPSFSRGYDTAANRTIAKKRRVIEWYDGSDSRDLNRQIMITAFLLGLSPVLDFNHIGHSMAGCYLESINPLKIGCDNSWDAIEQYGPKGLWMLTGAKAIPDGIAVPRIVLPVA